MRDFKKISLAKPFLTQKNLFCIIFLILLGIMLASLKRHFPKETLPINQKSYQDKVLTSEKVSVENSKNQDDFTEKEHQKLVALMQNSFKEKDSSLILEKPLGKIFLNSKMKETDPNNLSPTAENAAVSQRCFYQNQAYMSGDIIKTEQGWIRCTPTYLFLPESPGIRTPGQSAWTNVQ